MMTVAPQPTNSSLTSTEWMYVGSSLATSAAIGVVVLKAAGVISFTQPFLACVVTAVALRVLSELDLPNYMEAQTDKINFDLPPVEGQGTVAFFPINGSCVTQIINRGTDCFMNAVMQVIMHDEPLKRALFQTYEHLNTPEARAFIHAIQSYDRREVFSTYALRQFMPEGQQLGQQDASEFFHRLLNSVDVKIFPDLFQLQTTLYYWEQKDENEEVVATKTTSHPVREVGSFIEIPRENKVISGQELIAQHCALKKHEAELWYDEESKTLFSPGQAEVRIEGTRITFTLKRFSYPSNSKICTPVNMPEVLDLNGQRYTLRRVITHHGQTMSSGHYTSLLKFEDRWIKANDRLITDVTGDHLKDILEDIRNGYMFFYEISE